MITIVGVKEYKTIKVLKVCPNEFLQFLLVLLTLFRRSIQRGRFLIRVMLFIQVVSGEVAQLFPDASATHHALPNGHRELLGTPLLPHGEALEQL